MPMKLRPKGSNDPFYNPNRDLAYCYPQMVEEIAKRFNDHRWGYLESMAEQYGASFDSLCDAMDAYIAFLNAAHREPEKAMQQVMADSGWLSQPKAAQVAIMAMLGTVCTGQLFYAIREESTPEAGPQDVADLQQYMGQAKRVLYAHPWKERLRSWCRRLLYRRPRVTKGTEVSTQSS